MSNLWALIQSEPVRLVALVQTTLAFVVFGLSEVGVTMSEQLVALFMVAFSAWLAFFVRGKVTVTDGA